MWISREHYELIAQRAKEFRDWHEQQMADRAATIAEQERRIVVLETERTELLGRLFKREEERLRVPESGPDEGRPDWATLMQRQVEELNGSGEAS